MRVLSGLAATAAALPLVFVVAPSSASPAEETTSSGVRHERPVERPKVHRCQGRRATHVGAPGKGVTGTPGDDVIVSNGAYRVRGLAGDDLICVTRMKIKRPGSYPYVLAGAGDDRVRTFGSARRAAVIELGPGDDHFTGGPGVEYVHAESNHRADTGRDVIRTGGGNDIVSAGGSPGNTDTIHLGAGDDSLYLASPGTASTAHLDGGTGIDLVRIGDHVLDEVDNRGQEGIGRRDGEVVLRVSNFEDFGRVLTFWGGPADERVVVGEGQAFMGAGDDVIELALRHDLPRDAPSPVIDGGDGQDLLVTTWIFLGVGLARDLTVDLNLGRADLDGRSIAFTGIENSSAASYTRLRVVGTDGPNELSGLSCDTRIEGGGGDDLLFSNSGLDLQDESVHCAGLQSFGHGPAVLLGQDGDDVLRGGRGDDELVGGPGVDIADGQAGFDVCTAETVRNCEDVG